MRKRQVKYTFYCVFIIIVTQWSSMFNNFDKYQFNFFSFSFSQLTLLQIIFILHQTWVIGTIYTSYFNLFIYFILFYFLLVITYPVGGGGEKPKQLKAKEELWKLKYYFTMPKKYIYNNLWKNPLPEKKPKSFKILL